MLTSASTLKGYAAKASDGEIGTVADLLFDDQTWRVRWLVVNTGNWLSERMVLAHPTAIGAVDHAAGLLSLAMTKAQVEASPELFEHQPVSQQMEANLYAHYGWDPVYANALFPINPIAQPLSPPPLFGSDVAEAAADAEDADPHLRSVNSLSGYHIVASDGTIGHVESFAIDEAGWVIKYLIVDTKNWWPGKKVLISPDSVTEISWADRQIHVKLSGDQIKASPPWTPADATAQSFGWVGDDWRL